MSSTLVYNFAYKFLNIDAEFEYYYCFKLIGLIIGPCIGNTDLPKAVLIIMAADK